MFTRADWCFPPCSIQTEQERVKKIVFIEKKKLMMRTSDSLHDLAVYLLSHLYLILAVSFVSSSIWRYYLSCSSIMLFWSRSLVTCKFQHIGIAL